MGREKKSAFKKEGEKIKEKKEVKRKKKGRESEKEGKKGLFNYIHKYIFFCNRHQFSKEKLESVLLTKIISFTHLSARIFRVGLLQS